MAISDYVIFALSLVTAMVVQRVSPTPLIQAPWGTIQGVRVRGDEGRKMEGYYGIPYALPPTGPLRFEKPQPHPGPAQGEVFVADTMMPACPQLQPGLIGSSRQVSEDCLALNVFVPSEETHPAGPYPVMVFVHGGGFSMGDASFFRPSGLVADEKLIVVFIQYRLGALGFLSSGDDAHPGNYGLWDQHLALLWVKDNIRAFGGDPDAITIFGESAGSYSVGLHMFSPYSRGLFHRVIMQSASPHGIDLSSSSVDYQSVLKAVAELFQCQGDSSKALVACLKQQPVEEFFNKTTRVAASGGAISAFFFPRIDGDFLPRSIMELAADEQYVQENGADKIDVMMGFNNKEGAIALVLLLMQQQPLEALFSPPFYDAILSMCLSLGNNPADNLVLRRAVDFFYRGAEAGTSDTPVPLNAIIDLFGDCLITAGAAEWMRHLVSSPHRSHHYLYVMDHDFHFNRHGLVPGSHHADELFLEFDSEASLLGADSLFARINKTEIAAEERPLARKFVNIVATFAKTGNPSPALRDDLGSDWPEFTMENEAYVSISTSPHVEEKLGPYRDHVALWLREVPELLALTSGLRSSSPDKPQDQQPLKEEL